MQLKVKTRGGEEEQSDVEIKKQQKAKEKQVKESIDYLLHYNYKNPVVAKNLYINLSTLIKGYREEASQRKKFQKKYENSLSEFYGCQAIARRNTGRYKFACDYIANHVYQGQSGCEFEKTIQKYTGMENFKCTKSNNENADCATCVFQSIERADIESSIIDKFI